MDLVSDKPFWPWKNGLLSVYPPVRCDVRCDVVVLGAGISGALIAQALSEEGLDVVVVDRRDVGCGSTSASTALLQYEIDEPLVSLAKRYGTADAELAYKLCYKSIDDLDQLIARLELSCGFRRRSSVYLASEKSDAKLLKREYEARRKAGIEVEYWDMEFVSAHFPFERPAALASKQAAELDCYTLTHQLLAAATAAGARVFDQTIVEKYDPCDSCVRLKTDRGFRITASHAVFASGYESLEFLPKKVASLRSTYALASEPVATFPGWWERCLIWETARPYTYMRTTADSRILVGGEDDPFRNPERRDCLLGQKTKRLEKKFHEMFPAIELDVASRWAGTFAETKDGLAYIGQVRQMPRCYFALGFGGNGITYSVIASHILRDVLMDRENPYAHLFRFDR
jgi:glycine/D-amino acid oxidase-like deaminating enzyme